MSSKKISPVIMPLDLARKISEAAIEAVASIGVPFTVSIVDGTGHPVLITRMDGAAIASIETSITKARTAAYFANATKELANAVADGQPLATIQTSVPYPLTFVAGGIPVRDAQGTVIGAIGAGGASPQEDHDVAMAGARAAETAT